MKKIVLALLTIWFTTTAAQVPGPTHQEQVDNRGEAINLADTRRKLDQLIWGPEVLAQQYETRIVELWDDLLKAQDKFKVLADLDFNSLRLAAHQNSEGLQHQIARYTYSGDGETWSATQWKDFIAEAVANKYVLEQSEWHHSGFTPPQDNEGAHSEVSFELHVARAEPFIGWQASVPGPAETVRPFLKRSVGVDPSVDLYYC